MKQKKKTTIILIKEIHYERVTEVMMQYKTTTIRNYMASYFFFLPNISFLAVNLTLSPKVTTIMTGHGNIRSYLHRLKIIGRPECPCKHGTQTVEHLIFRCNRLKNEREKLKKSVLRVGNWPVSKSELTNRYLKQFVRYVNSMDLEKLNHSN
jgi:hypothetical protein